MYGWISISVFSFVDKEESLKSKIRFSKCFYRKGNDEELHVHMKATTKVFLFQIHILLQ